MALRVTVAGTDLNIVLIGRAADIVAFVTAKAEQINRAPRGSVEFNFDDRTMKPSIHEHYAGLRTEET